MSFLVVIVALTVVVNIISDRICAYSVVGGVVLDGVTAGDGIRWYNIVVIALTMAVDVTSDVVGADNASSRVIVVGSQ